MMLEPFATGYLSVEGAPCTRIAQGLLYAARELPVHVNPVERIAGHNLQSTAIGYGFGGGISVNADAMRKLCAEHPEEKDRLEEMLESFYTLDCGRLHDLAAADDERAANRSKVMWGGRWGGHTIFGYDELLKSGTNSIRARIEKQLAATEDSEKAEFYHALITTCEAFETYAMRFAEEADRLLESEGSPQMRENLTAVSKNCRTVPRGGAENFEQAVQSFWLCAMFDGVDSPGRMDQFLYPYYQTTTHDKAYPLLCELWEKFNQVRIWNVCISGMNPDGSDSTNALSYMILDLAEKYRCKAPNLTMRTHKGTPAKLWRRAAEVIATGIGMPSLYNDDIVVTALQKLGITHEDACNYALNGCNQIDIQGKSHMGLEDGELTLVKCLELALNRGICAVTGKRLAPDFGDPLCCESFSDLLSVYRQNVEYFTRMIVRAANTSQEIYDKHAPAVFRSLFIEGCIEKGKNFKGGGPVYNHGQILTEGIADTADSLAAIKYFVYDNKQVTMERMLAALHSNFEDRELQRLLKACPHRFGNDDLYVDSLAADIIEHFFTYLLSFQTYRGGIYGGGCSTFNRAADYGKMVGAMPNGRLSGESLADSVGAYPGQDQNGPTALINSAARYPHGLAMSGFVLQLKFNKQIFSTEAGIEAFIALAKTYFSKNGQQLSVNVLDAAELIAAKKEPDKYKNLIVRVGGFSEYFINLTDDLKDNVISRTMNWS
jgi:pyruvate-formate lyase